MPQPRSLRFSRPTRSLRSNSTGLLGIRNGQIWVPCGKGAANQGAVSPTGVTIWFTENQIGSTNIDNAFVERFDWPNTSASIRFVITPTSGVAPNLYYSLNGGAETLGTGVNIGVKTNDVMKIGVRPSVGAVASGVVTVQNRPEMGSRTYSYGIV
jgi:hypothetical protein